MVVSPARWLVGFVLELLVVFAEGMGGAFAVAFLLGKLLLETIAFGPKLLESEFELGDLLDVQGALRTRSSNHGNSSEQAEKGTVAEGC